MTEEYTIYVPPYTRLPVDAGLAVDMHQEKIDHFLRSLQEAVVKLTGYEDAFKCVSLEFKVFQTTNTTAQEIRCCDRLIGLIYTTRTAFNHQEIVCLACVENFADIKKSIQSFKEPWGPKDFSG